MQGGDVKEVKITGLTLIKIMKHSKETQDNIVSGQLQGIFDQEKQKLEITYSYPWPAKDENQPEIFDNYIADLTKRIEDTQIDSFQIGWYLFSQKNDYLSYDNFNAHYEFQKKIPFAVFLVYDQLAQQRGQRIPFKILKISDKVMEILKQCESENGLISNESIKALDQNKNQIYDEIQFEIENSPLIKAFLVEYQDQIYKQSEKQQKEQESILEQNLEMLLESFAELDEQNLNLNDGNLKGQQKQENQVSLLKQKEADNYMDVLISIQRTQEYIEMNQNYNQMMFESENLLNNLADESF